MKKILVALLFLFFVAYSLEETEIETQAKSAPLELAKEDWRLLSLGAIMLSIALVAMAYMIGHAFEVPELKAWASSELVQVFVTVIIIMAFTATVFLLDAYLESIVNQSNLGFSCSGSKNCAVTVATQYLDGLKDTCEGQIRTNLKEATSAAKWAYSRWGLSTPVLIPMLQMSTAFTFTAHMILETERRNVVIEYLGNILSSIYSQEFFVSEISYKLAPLILVIGIVARSFFITRRMGGLLIAVGIGVMYVFPLMYVFDWLTLNITLFGASSVEPSTTPCPAACVVPPPKFYAGDGTRYFTRAELVEHLVAEGFSESAISSDVSLLDAGKVPSRTFGSEQIYSCFNNTCPTECRDLPYPVAPTCQASENITACAALDSRCKTIRYATPTGTSADNYSDGDYMNGECPIKCRMVPPLRSDCGAISDCVSASDFCKFTRRDNLAIRPDGCENDPAVNCPASLNASQSCVWVLPSKADLDAHACDSCNFVPQVYVLDPPIYLSCTDLCNPSPTGPPKINPATFARRSAEGMAGREEIKVVSTMMLPAYVLPILNILVTLIFIRSFSQIIGGDIEIPGITRIL